jgi:hypothetical protein
MTHGAALLKSQKLTDAMMANLNKLSEAHVLQINKDDSTKSALSRLGPDQASLFLHLLTANSFEMVDGVPELNEFTTKLTKSQDPMRAVNMVQQATRPGGGPLATRVFYNFSARGTLPRT